MTDTTNQAAAPAVEDAVDAAGETARDVIDNVQRVIVGNDEAIEHLVTALLGGGHVLLEDVPGVGKTMLARAVAESFDCSFKRVQFTPDLLPADITGANVYNQQSGEFEFRPGPVFGNVVLGDEINRAPPKTQAALLEAMEEEQVTVDGTTHSVPDPFIVIATQNSIERERTYELPAAELDRFMLKLHLGYPDEADEATVIDRAVGGHAIDDVEPVATAADLLDARATTADVAVSEPVRAYVTRLATYTREHARLGASPRGSIALVRAAQGRAVLDSRSYVVPDDVQAAASVVLPHRMQTDPGADDADAIVSEALETVPVEE
ncbi:MoxR family ATPase [Natronomonas salina]|uniref:AAA family ATPase n=1 Tax=Natronomonas salina TaxID=1710540 RepID=UPI0015B5820B|nr:MoxR family ATPase [Natronomonas salina]QLD89356.1 MoxR family ATPase [Natronomonas salina]